MSKTVFKINQSNLLDRLTSEPSFKSKTILEQIEFLNRYRARNGLRRWGRDSILDTIIDDQSGRSITFNPGRWTGLPCNPITCRYVGVSDINYTIRYPVKNCPGLDADNFNGRTLDFIPDGDAYIERDIKAFLRHNSKTSWAHNSDHDKLFKYLLNQYLNAWLDLKHRKVLELKTTIDTDSVNEFIAAKRAQHTQAIMDIAMAVGALTGKLETYRNRIGNVTTTYEAEKMFAEVESAFRHFHHTQERNAKRLNKKVRLPGGKSLKKFVESDKE